MKQHPATIPLTIKKIWLWDILTYWIQKKNYKKKQFQIEVAKIKYNSTLQLKALHDPTNILMKK